MPPTSLKKVSDNWHARSNATINAAVTSLVLKASGATGLNVPCIIHNGTEKLAVTAIDVDTPSAGLDTLTVTRGYGGTTAASHTADSLFYLWSYKEYHNEVADKVNALMMLLHSLTGQNDGAVLSDGNPELAVTAQGTPDMTVNVAPGGVIVGGEPYAILETAVLTFTAPTTNPRIDLIQIGPDGVTAKTGTEAASPSAPTADADSAPIWTIYHRVGETSIKDSDDATNGYIQTDSRVPI